jgi:hypothetical protein
MLCLVVGSSHIEGGLNMGLLLQALFKTKALTNSTSVAHSTKGSSLLLEHTNTCFLSN